MTRTVAAALLLLCLAASPLAAANEQGCLSRDEQRAAVEGGQAVPLAAAIKVVHGRAPDRQVVHAQLCRAEKGLVYVLTVLARDGKVTHTRVEASSGGLIDGL
jgi:hypothetical protein